MPYTGGFFTRDLILSSKFLNRLGVPVLRNILTNFIINLKRYKNCKPKNNLELELIKNGVLVIPNFLPKEEFSQLKEEFNNLISKKNDMDRNLIGTKFVKIKDDDFNKLSGMRTLRDNKRLNRLVCLAEGLKKIKINNFLLENTKFHSLEKQRENPNNFYHDDIHFHSHKFFFYINDVSNDDGPFTYLKKTHLNNFDRLYFDFKRAQLPNAEDLLWRIEKNLENEFIKDYFEKIIKHEFKAIGSENTLVIGNVHGFHKLGDAIQGRERQLIRMTFRHSPLEFINKILK